MTRRLVPLVVLAATGCAPLHRAVAPIRTPSRAAAEIATALEEAGPELRPDLFAPDATLHLRDTVLTGPDVRRYWGPGGGGRSRYENARHETRGIFVCSAGAVQVGRYVAEQRLPGATAPVTVTGRWMARWRETGAGWRIVDATLRPSLLAASPFAIDPDCVAPSEAAMVERRTDATLQWGGLWSHGGPAPGIEGELGYVGLEEVTSASNTWALGLGRRLAGPWGARVLLAHRVATGSGVSADEPVALRNTSTIAALLAMHERWLLRVAAGPAVAHVDWTWDGPQGESSSEWVPGWVNELSVAIPVFDRAFLDLSYHDWLFGESSPPLYQGVGGLPPRLRGSTVSLGAGWRF